MLTDCGQSVGQCLALRKLSKERFTHYFRQLKKKRKEKEHQTEWSGNRFKAGKRSGSSLHSAELSWGSLPWDAVGAKIKNGLKTSEHISTEGCQTKMQTKPLAPETKLLAANIWEAALR